LDNKNFNLKTTGHILLQFYALIVLLSSLSMIKMGIYDLDLRPHELKLIATRRACVSV